MFARDAERLLDIWVLADHKTGLNNQCIGVAQKLAGRIRVIPVEEIVESKLMPFLEREAGLGHPVQHWPDVVISASPNTEYAAGRMKHAARDKIFNVKLSAPDKDAYNDFDLIARHDPPGVRHINPNADSNKVIFTVGVPHKVTPELVEEGTRLWEQQFSQLPGPRIAVLVGGDTSPIHPFTPTMAAKFGKDIEDMAKRAGGSLIITNSRRTPQRSTEEIFRHITVPAYLHDSRMSGENPYFGMLGVADGIVATGDSMSMVCEGCSTGKPVYYYPLSEIEMPYHGYLQRKMTELGQARAFDGKLEHWSYTPLDVAGQVADEVRTRMQQKAHAR